jgi:hypothetical protein
VIFVVFNKLQAINSALSCRVVMPRCRESPILWASTTESEEAWFAHRFRRYFQILRKRDSEAKDFLTRFCWLEQQLNGAILA